MNRRVLERSLWLGATCLAIGAGIRGSRAARVSEAAADPVPPGSVARSSFPPESLGAWAQSAIAADPFRLERRPSAVRFDPTRPAVEEEPAPPPPPPALTLLGTVGGPPWQALLSGIPGKSGTVVAQAGDLLGGVTVQAVSRDSAVVSWADTTWTLVVRRPWK